MSTTEAILTTVKQLWDPVWLEQAAIAYLEASGWQVILVFTYVELTEPGGKGGVVIGRGDLFRFAFRHAMQQLQKEWAEGQNDGG